MWLIYHDINSCFYILIVNNSYYLMKNMKNQYYTFAYQWCLHLHEVEIVIVNCWDDGDFDCEYEFTCEIALVKSCCAYLELRWDLKIDDNSDSS